VAVAAFSAHQMLDRFLDAGGTFIDTADVYGDGESERTLAPWLVQTAKESCSQTKVRFAVSDRGGEGLAPDRIRAARNASLRRLGVEAIDLYQVHGPDPTAPLEKTLAALDGLVRAGKVRTLGASNFPAWLLAWSVAIQDREGWRRSSVCSLNTRSWNGRPRSSCCPCAGRTAAFQRSPTRWRWPPERLIPRCGALEHEPAYEFQLRSFRSAAIRSPSQQHQIKLGSCYALAATFLGEKERVFRLELRRVFQKSLELGKPLKVD
jgi:hypothetical protein